MKRQNQSIAFVSLFAQSTPLLAVVPLLPLVLGGWLALTADAIAAAATQTVQVQIIPSNILIAQAVVDTLPPPPPSVNLAKEQLSSPSFTPRELDFEAPVASPASTNSNSYLVYVNDSSFPTLQQVQQLEPKAFVRQYNGHSVIQAGVFSKNSNAQELAKELQSKGLGVRLVSLATGEEIDFEQSNSYFVVIPASRDNLPLVAAKVKQLRIDIPVSISQKDQPRGPHIRVGPFLERIQAERLNRYMVDSGLRNARVYYGR